MIDALLLSELEIVAHRGAESASQALSSFLAVKVHIEVNGVELSPLEQIPERLGSSETLAVGLLSRVCGEIEGNAVLLFSRNDALQLVRLLGGRPSNETVEGFGDLERSMLEETANITISSFINSMTAHLNHPGIPNAPVYLLDMVGAILSVILMESAKVADSAILFSTRFACQEEQLNALFAFLPSPVSLAALEEGLTSDH